MSVATHIMRAGGLYYLRVRFPADLRRRLGKTEFRRSLGTSSAVVAKRQAGVLYARLIDALELVRAMPDDFSDAAYIAKLEETLAMAAEAHEAEMQVVKLQAQLDRLNSAMAAIQRAKANREIIKQFTQAAENLETKVSDAAISSDNRSRSIAIQKEYISRREQELNVQELAVANPAVAEALAIVQKLQSQSRPSRDMKTPTIISYMNDIHIQEKKLNDGANRHILNYVNLFARVCGDRSLAGYTRTDVLKWISVLEKMKNTYGKSSKDFGKSISEILKETKAANLPTLSEKTIKNHRVHVRALFMTSIKHYKYASSDDIDNMFSDIKLSDSVPVAQQRKVWSFEQLTELFRSPIWAGTRSRSDDYVRRNEPGKNIHKDAYWWLPIIALHTGCRVEEIAQLQHGDLQYDKDGVSFIEINTDDGKRVKKAHGNVGNGIRNIPIHKLLIELGFLKLFKTDNPKLSAKRIFPELIPRGREAKLSQMYSTHFSEYRQKVGLYEELRDFHSLRHTFISAMQNDFGVAQLLVARLAGHESSDTEFQKLRMTHKYTTYSIKHLNDAVQQLDYEGLGVDFSNLRKTLC